MSRTKAIEYLKYLHGLESKYKCDLMTLEFVSLVEQVRLRFVAEYTKQ